MFKKLKIRVRMALGCGCIAVFVIIVGLTGIFSIRALDNDMESVYKSGLEGIYYSGKLDATINMIHAQYLNLLANTGDADTVQQISAVVDELESEFSKYYDQYQTSIVSNDAEDARLLEELRKNYFDILLPLGQQMQSAARSGNAAQARSIYVEMNRHGEQIIASAENLLEYNRLYCVEANEKLNTEIDFSTGLIIAIIVVSAAIMFLISNRLSMSLVRPIGDLVTAAKAITEGNVDVRIENKSPDETGQLSRAFTELANSFREQARVLQKIAEGDFTIDIAVRSAGDVVNKAIRDIIDKNNQMLSEIRIASDQVSSGAQQIALGAQSLASGSSEQAASIEEFSAAISAVQEQSEENTQQAAEAFDDTQRAASRMAESMESMGRMTLAMQEINESSNNIAKVIKVIDDIAFQTNILALNAAVEAARAGQHGKGFAVVADEVRNLASKSATAAKETAVLIESSTQKVAEGNEIVQKTNASLEEVSQFAANNAIITSKINESSQRQSTSISEINQGINQISSVVQQNSATAEQSAATAQQMSAQAQMLSEIVARFKLKEGTMSFGGGLQTMPSFEEEHIYTGSASTAFSLAASDKY